MIEFWATFFLMFFTVGLFLGIVIGCGCNRKWTKIVVTLVVAIFFAGTFTLVITTEYDWAEKEWNDGYCECGGCWDFVNASRYRNTTHYYYECDECGYILDSKYNFGGGVK